MSLIQEVKQEAKAIKKAERRDGNTLLDRLVQGAAGAGILYLAFDEVLSHVRALEPVNYMLAAGAIVGLLYALLAPEFRKR